MTLAFFLWEWFDLGYRGNKCLAPGGMFKCVLEIFYMAHRHRIQ